MAAADQIPASNGPAPRVSTLIAEALVERQSARQIIVRAAELGLPKNVTRVVLAACCGKSYADNQSAQDLQFGAS